MKNSSLFLSSIIGLSLIAALFFGVYTFDTNQKQNLKNEAVQGCMEVSLYRSQRTNDEGISITTEEPIKTAIDSCLKSKGY